MKCWERHKIKANFILGFSSIKIVITIYAVSRWKWHMIFAGMDIRETQVATLGELGIKNPATASRFETVWQCRMKLFPLRGNEGNG